MNCQPGCEYPPGHVSEHPCGIPHVPGSPCRYCGKPTPADGSACPECWVSLADLSHADIKAVFARSGIGLEPPQAPAS